MPFHAKTSPLLPFSKINQPSPKRGAAVRPVAGALDVHAFITAEQIREHGASHGRVSWHCSELHCGMEAQGALLTLRFE